MAAASPPPHPLTAPPAASPAPRQRRKQARPQELLAAALELFVEKGFAATRTEEVAARAGVSKGTLYLYYPSKQDLFKAMVRESLVAQIHEAAALSAQHQGPVAELLGEVLQAWWERVGRSAAGGIAKIMVAEARNFPELAAFYAEEVILPIQTLLVGLIERGVARGEFRPVPAEAAVHVLIGPILHMILYQHSFGACACGGPTIEPAVVLRVQLDLMLHGLLAGPAPRP